MNDQTVKVKKNEYKKRKTDNDKIECDIEITDEVEIKFKKDAKKGETTPESGEIKVKVQKYKENGDKDGEKVVGTIKKSDIKYNGGYMMQGVKFKKVSLDGGGEINLKEELDPKVKGFKTTGYLIMGGGAVIVLVIIGGLI